MLLWNVTVRLVKLEPLNMIQSLKIIQCASGCQVALLCTECL